MGFEPNVKKMPYEIYCLNEKKILLFTQIENGTFVIINEDANILLFSLEAHSKGKFKYMR
jgi:hypothetical protein